MVVSGKLHHHRLETDFAQFLCPDATVIEIPGKAAPQRDTDLAKAAGDRASDDPKPRMAFADIVEQSGTGFAFPSQTLYFGRDDGLDTNRAAAAAAQVREWREQGCLPFPDFSPEQIRQMRRKVPYPPPGSPDAPTTGSGS